MVNVFMSLQNIFSDSLPLPPLKKNGHIFQMKFSMKVRRVKMCMESISFVDCLHTPKKYMFCTLVKTLKIRHFL